METKISLLAKKYIKWGQDFLNKEHGSFKSLTTGMDVEEDTTNEEFRNSLKEEILKDSSVNNCWWEKENYGHTLWLSF